MVPDVALAATQLQTALDKAGEGMRVGFGPIPYLLNALAFARKLPFALIFRAENVRRSIAGGGKCSRPTPADAAPQTLGNFIEGPIPSV
jgi:hypothetical protein